jgi:uncharacterized protein (DUF342 family)
MGDADNNIIIEAASLEEALTRASKRFGIARESVKYEFVTDSHDDAPPGRRGWVKIKIIDDFFAKHERFRTEISINNLIKEAEAFANTKDGYIRLEVVGDDIVLTIYPHIGVGKPVTIKDAYERLNNPRYLNLARKAVMAAFEPRGVRKPQIVARLNPEYKDVDARPVFEVSDDRMALYLKFVPPRGMGRYPKYEEIERLVFELGVRSPVDKLVVENAIKNRVGNSSFLISKGEEPVNGSDTRIEWTLERTGPEKIVYLRPDGSVDFKRIYLLSNIRKDQMIGNILKASAGIEGHDIYGALIPPRPGREKSVAIGKNIFLNEEGDKLISAIDGQVKFECGVANVYQVYELFDDVNYKTGNIDFAGSVIIKGTVLDGFSVKAGGNVYVENPVGEATIIAEGDICLPGGFIGKNKGYLRAGKSVLLKFAEGGVIEAKERVVADMVIIHSKVTAGDKIEAVGKRGQIIGGELFASNEIIARTIGAPVGVATKLNLGFDTLSLEYFENLCNDLILTEKEIEKLYQAQNYLRMSTARGEKKIEGDTGEMVKRLDVTRATLETKIDYLRGEKERVLKEMNTETRGVVKVIDVMYGGVVINIKNVLYNVNSKIISSALHLENQEVRIFPL